MAFLKAMAPTFEMTTLVEARCQCGLNAFNVAFSTASLPVPNIICHCNTCRHVSGQLARNYAPIQGVPLSPVTGETADLSTLTTYKTSENVTRWFCGSCSANMFATYSAVPDWYVSVGILQQSDGIVSSKAHIWVSDTLDGGLANHLRAIEGYTLPRYSTWQKEGELEGAVLPLEWNLTKGSTAGQEHDRLSMYCHCKTVSLDITRPTAESALPSAPYPDVMFPHRSTPMSKLLNPNDEKWWLRPAGAEKPTKYLAGYCACTLCTLVSGSEYSSWVFIPRVNIKISTAPSSDASVDLNLKEEAKRPKGLKQHVSSPGRYREFCGTCGANVFLWFEEGQDIVAVATGLVDQGQGGARAEGWLEWHKDRVTFAEDGIRKTLVEGLIQGLKDSK